MLDLEQCLIHDLEIIDLALNDIRTTFESYEEYEKCSTIRDLQENTRGISPNKHRGIVVSYIFLSYLISIQILTLIYLDISQYLWFVKSHWNTSGYLSVLFFTIR